MPFVVLAAIAGILFVVLPAGAIGNEAPVKSGAVHDARNPLEAIHLTADPDNDGAFGDSPLYLGRWRVTVGRGLGRPRLLGGRS